MAGNRTLKLSILADVDDLKKKLDSGGKDVDGFGGKLENFGKAAAAAFAAAAAAAVAYAGKLAIDGVKAAIEDEAAQAKLANALKNVTGATNDQIAAVEKQITKLALATGTADDALRPAFQRLAVATGNVEEAQKLLNIALDVSAATGKPLEAVTNALGKAYEGNTSSLARLGIGMSTAEIKALGLEGTVAKLAETFGGAADVQANTFQGRIERLKVAFDEAKESIGAALLPILEKLMDFIVNKVVPFVQNLTDSFAAKSDGLNKYLIETYNTIRDFVMPIFEAYREAIFRITDAVNDNKESIKDLVTTLKELFDFVNKYIVPVFEFILVQKIKQMSEQIQVAIRVLVPVVEFVANQIKNLINGIIAGINAVINLYNSIASKLGGTTIGTISSVGQGSGGVGLGNRPTGGTTTGGSSGTSNGSISGSSSGGITGNGTIPGSKLGNGLTAIADANKKVADAIAGYTFQIPMSVADIKARESGDIINYGVSNIGGLNVAGFRAGEERSVVININGAIDPSSTARQIAQILNTEAATAGSFTNLGTSRFATRSE